MRPVTAETVKAEIDRLEAFEAFTTRRLSITEEFHLGCLKQLYAVMHQTYIQVGTDALTDEKRIAFIESMREHKPTGINPIRSAHLRGKQ